MRKWIVFILAAVLISCSQKENKVYVNGKTKEKDYSEPYKNNSSRPNDYYYERSLDTIQVSGQYVIVAIYRCRNSVSSVVIGKQIIVD